MIHTQDPDFTLICADVLDGLRSLPDGSVHCVVTSPPYWGLRDYGTGSWDGGDANCEHKVRERSSAESSTLGGSKATVSHAKEGFREECPHCGARRIDQQLGLEPTPEAYVARMVDVFREVRRVLRPDGTCWVNLGDSYHGGGGGNYGSGLSTASGHGQHLTNVRNRIDLPGLKPKDLVGIPWRVAFALQADGWYLRSDIIWSKPNPMPESVTDRPTKAHEYVFLLTRSPRYFFDQEAVREPSEDKAGRVIPEGYKATWANGNLVEGKQAGLRDPNHFEGCHASGRNVRSVWDIATQPYPEAHFATYPEELVRRCILAATSERGCCPVCGTPWEREMETSYEKSPVHGAGSVVGRHYETGANNFDGAGMPRLNKKVETLGWRPGCDCGDERGVVLLEELPPIPCTVLDPFLGSGTTAYVARKHGRRSIGIELNPAYAELAARRMQQQSLFA